VVLWDAAGRNRLSEEPLAVKEGDVRSVAFSPDGKTIAAGCGGGRNTIGGVVLWDGAGRNRLSEEPLAAKEGYVMSVAFSRDGKTIAAGYDFDVGGGVVLWDGAGRNRLSEEPLAVKEGDVRSVAFSPDGKTIAAGYGSGFGGAVVLWDAAGRNRLEEPLAVKEVYVVSVAFSPDGKTIAAGYGGGRIPGGVVLWDVDLESWQRIAGQIANRNFTWDEWHQYFPDELYRRTFPDHPDGLGVAEARQAQKSISSRPPTKSGTETARQ
jgi:WD40 repeat protein